MGNLADHSSLILLLFVLTVVVAASDYERLRMSKCKSNGGFCLKPSRATNCTVIKGHCKRNFVCCDDCDIEPNIPCRRKNGTCKRHCGIGEYVVKRGCNKWKCKCCVNCTEKPKCSREGGFCVTRRRDCPSNITMKGCKGKGCRCCLPEFETTPGIIPTTSESETTPVIILTTSEAETTPDITTYSARQTATTALDTTWLTSTILTATTTTTPNTTTRHTTTMTTTTTSTPDTSTRPSTTKMTLDSTTWPATTTIHTSSSTPVTTTTPTTTIMPTTTTTTMGTTTTTPTVTTSTTTPTTTTTTIGTTTTRPTEITSTTTPTTTTTKKPPKDTKKPPKETKKPKNRRGARVSKRNGLAISKKEKLICDSEIYLDKDMGLVSVPINELSLQKFSSLPCKWHISVKPGRVVRLSFSHSDFQKGVSISPSKYMTFIDGVTKEELHLEEEGSNGIPDSITSKSNKVQVVFEPKSFKGGVGFSFSYSAVHPNL